MAAPQQKKKLGTFAKYFEKVFSYLLEFIAAFDMISDILFLIEIWKGNQLAWFIISIFTIIGPYYICYVPLLRYQRRTMIGDHPTLAQRIALYCAFTPLVLIYLFMLDLLYLLNAVVLSPIVLVFNLLTCCYFSKKVDFEEKVDEILGYIFNLEPQDIVGFRKLRTMTQFTFESLP